MIALIILVVITAFVALSSILYFKKSYFKSFYHDVLGWHTPNGSAYFDGCSVYSKCKYCGKDIMQDSQGNWF